MAHHLLSSPQQRTAALAQQLNALQCCSVLFGAVPCCAVRYCDMLCRAVPCCCFSVLLTLVHVVSYQVPAESSLAHQLGSATHRSASSAVQHRAVPCCTVRCCAVPCCAMLFCCTYHVQFTYSFVRARYRSKYNIISGYRYYYTTRFVGTTTVAHCRIA